MQFHWAKVVFFSITGNHGPLQIVHTGNRHLACDAQNVFFVQWLIKIFTFED